MVTSLIRPSYSNGFARSAGESIKPNEWRRLVGAWKMSLGPTGTILHDFSGKGNNGTLTNMDPTTDWVISGNPKLPGYCLEFDGINDHVVSGLNKTAVGGVLSISFWARPTGAQEAKGIFNIAVSVISGSPWILCQRVASSSIVKWYLSSGYRITISSINDDTWYHFALTYDGTTWIAYKDGQSAGSYTGGLGGNSASNLWIGSGYSGSFNGNIDDFRVYSRALTAAEIRDIYNYPNVMYTLRRRVYKAPAAPPAGGTSSQSIIISQVVNQFNNFVSGLYN